MRIIPDNMSVNKREGYIYYQRDTIEISDDDWNRIHDGYGEWCRLCYVEYRRTKQRTKQINFAQYLHELISLAHEKNE